jgi:hypothetical protein
MRFYLFHKKYGAQFFDTDAGEDLKADLYPLGWRENKRDARQAGQASDMASWDDDDLSRWSRTDLERLAREQYGIELDRRKKPENMVRELREKLNGDSR